MERVSEMERGQKQRIWQKVKSNIAVLCLKFSLKNPLELRHKNVSAAASLKLKQNFYLFLPMLGDVCAQKKEEGKPSHSTHYNFQCLFFRLHEKKVNGNVKFIDTEPSEFNIIR